MQSLRTLPYQKEFLRRSTNIIPNRLKVVDLGNIDYLRAYEYQKQTLDGIIKNIFPDTLIFCQHPHTITTTHLAKTKNLLVDKDYLKNRKINFFVVDRGGDITYHGPGQLIIYPIFDLRKHKKDLKFFLTDLEEVIIDFLHDFEIIAKRRTGYTGAWIDNRKIASIGIGVKKWISFHGLAINLCTNLSFFSIIRPCGLEIKMTSIKEESGKKIDFNLAKKIILQKFIEKFHYKLKKEEDINDECCIAGTR